MRLLTGKDGDLLYCFDKIDERQNGVKGSSSNNIVIDNHEVEADSGKVEGHLPLVWNIFLDSVKHSGKSKKLGFHLNLKTADFQGVTYTNIVVAIKKTTIDLYLFKPTFNHDSPTLSLFNESIKYNFKLTFDSWSSIEKRLLQAPISSWLSDHFQMVNQPNF